MPTPLGKWTLALDGGAAPERALVGGKAWSLARMRELDLPVPPAFVVTTKACTEYLKNGAEPAELAAELASGIAWLEGRTGRTFGKGPKPLLVSVRSGAAISMPGMMDTVLNLGTNDATENALGIECGDAAFAKDTHRRFLELYATIVLRATAPELDRAADPAQWRQQIAAAAGAPVPDTASEQLQAAVRAVFESWNSRRARRYRQHNNIPDELGTAVTVQAMVFGNLDAHSGTGVLFSRNPLDGSPEPYGEYLPRAQGEDVVSGKFTPKPLDEMRKNVPEALEGLLAAARALEAENGDVQDIEFTVQRSKLWLLQSRAAKRAAPAALRIAVDLVNEKRIDKATALARVTPEQLASLTNPCLEDPDNGGKAPLATGESACPGVGIGVVVTDSDEAEKRAAAGEYVVLARPTTSPEDLHGMIAAKAIVTEQGGSTSHAAVVSRSLGRPCVVGCGDGQLTALKGRTVTVCGTTGRIHDGALPVMRPSEVNDFRLAQFMEWKRAAEAADTTGSAAQGDQKTT
ncbi:MAG: pyruvate, phosphate dikinase [Panacagrimonas sp.]